MFKIWTPKMQKVRKVCPPSKVVTLFKAPAGVLMAILTNYISKRQLFRQPWDNCMTTLRQLWYYFGTPLKHLFGTAFGQLWNIHGHLWDNWKQLLDKFGNLWGNLGQLWDNFETTLGQLWTNVETTLVQLWDNWIQLWRNFETNPG